MLRFTNFSFLTMRLLFFVVFFFVFGCFENRPIAKEPIGFDESSSSSQFKPPEEGKSKQKKAKDAKKTQGIKNKNTSETKPTESSLAQVIPPSVQPQEAEVPLRLSEKPVTPESNCHFLTHPDKHPPLFIKEKGIMLTRLFKACYTPTGEKGYETASPWMAMGFPCTAGEGRVDWEGNYYLPKMVSLIFSTNCPMKPQDSELTVDWQKTIGLELQKKPVAYTPFVVQYWEIPESDFGGTGYSVAFPPDAKLERLWKKINAKTPIKVKLYGRENAWGQEKNMFSVEGDVIALGRDKFRFDLQNAKALSDEQITEISKHCQKYKSKLICDRIFIEK